MSALAGTADGSSGTAAGGDPIRGRAIMLSYQELMTIRLDIQAVKGMMEATLRLQGTVDAHEQRIATLERALDYGRGRKSAWRSLLLFLGGVASAVIGGGALQYLPSIMGWFH